MSALSDRICPPCGRDQHQHCYNIQLADAGPAGQVCECGHLKAMKVRELLYLLGNHDQERVIWVRVGDEFLAIDSLVAVGRGTVMLVTRCPGQT